jgi:transcriptional regulator with XRE-family HTH domain
MTQSDRNGAFRKRLKELMAARDFTQSNLAAEIWGRRLNDEGIEVARGRDLISAWVSGRKLPDLEHFERLVKALGVKASDLDPEADQ